MTQQTESPTQVKPSPAHTTDVGATATEGRRWPLEPLVRAPEFGALVAAVVLYLFFVVTTAGNGFVTANGTASWLDTASELGILAVPIGLLMIAGEFDLSVGSMVGASSMTMGVVCGHYHDSLLVGIVVALALALVVGVANGLLVTRTGLPSFIVTLAANLILAGLALAIAQSLAQTTQISFTPSGPLNTVLSGQVGQFDASIGWWAAIVAAAAWVLGKRRFGNWILATGGGTENARRAGVPTSRVKVSLFVCAALAGALVGVIQAVQFSTGDATTGQGYVFEAPIVVVIGGVLLTGGYGSILGVVLGTVIYGFVNAGLFYTGWNTDYAQVVIGVLMVIAVLTNNFVRQLAVRTVRPKRER